MNRRTTIYPRVAAAALGCLGLVWGVGGCSTPSNQPVPRGPSNETSDTEMREPVMTDFLDSMVSDAVGYLAVTLPNLPDVKQSKTQLVFAVPQTLKIEGNIPDTRIEAALLSMRTQLQQNSAFTDNFMVISATDIQANGTLNSMQSDNSAFRDPLQQAPDRTKAKNYDPSLTYTMSGRMYLLNDPTVGHKQLKFFIQVENMLGRTPVVSKEIVYNLTWDGQNGRWVKE